MKSGCIRLTLVKVEKNFVFSPFLNTPPTEHSAHKKCSLLLKSLFIPIAKDCIYNLARK